MRPVGAGRPRPCMGTARQAEGGCMVKQCDRSLGLGSIATCGQGVEPEGHLQRAQCDPWRQAQGRAGCHSLGFSLLCHYPSDFWKNAADDSTSWRISKQCPNFSAGNPGSTSPSRSSSWPFWSPICCPPPQALHPGPADS